MGESINEYFEEWCCKMWINNGIFEIYALKYPLWGLWEWLFIVTEYGDVGFDE